jgi:N-methylhydantoinase A
VPGPACYGRGGTRPTVTDAAASLGMLADGRLAGDMRLDLAVAERVMADLGAALGLSADQAAAGVLSIVVASMANAIRTVTVQKGIDPRGGHLIAYGGAGPLLAVPLARELAIDSVVIPRYAGAFSAWGLLAQDLTRSTSRTHVTRLDTAGLDTANAVLAGLFERMENGNRDGMRRQCALDCRYEGQEYTLTVAVPGATGRIVDTPETVRSLFATEYRRVFGYELPDDVEIVSMRATLSRPLSTKAGAASQAPVDGQWEQVSAYSFATKEVVDFDVADRDAIAPGSRLPGPLIVREATATTYVDVGFVLECGPEAELMLAKEA